MGYVTVDKDFCSKDEFMGTAGERLITSALTGQNDGELAIGQQAVNNLRAGWNMQGGENITADLFGDNADGTARGGILPPAHGKRFFEWAKDRTPFLPLIHSFDMPSTQTVIARTGLGTRVLHGSSELNPMADNQKARMIYGAQDLTTRKYMGQMDLSYEMLEDTIERGNFRSRIMRMIAEQVGADMEYIIINSDTNITAGHPYQDYAEHWDLLNKQDGLLKRCFTQMPSGKPGEGKIGANRTDVAGSTINVPMWYSLEHSLPEKYRRANEQYYWITTRAVDLNWREYLTDRPTAIGDTYIFKNQSAMSLGLPIITVPQLPHDIEINGDDILPGDKTMIFLMQPQNVVMGWWRRIMIESTKDIERQVYKMVISMRLGFTVWQPDAIAMLENVGVHY